MKNIVLLIFLSLLFLSCERRGNTYSLREYSKMPEGLSRKAFQKVINQNNSSLNTESGYFKIYDLIQVDISIRRNFPYEDNYLFFNLYATKQDADLIEYNINKLGSIKQDRHFWPSVVLEMFSNSKIGTRGKDQATQKAYRDSVDKYLGQILKVSKYKFKPSSYYADYKRAMRIKKSQQ